MFGKERKKYKQLKVRTAWSKDDIKLLIRCVRDRPVLWTANSGQYKLAIDSEWQEVNNLIGKQSANECRAKWTILRVIFRKNFNRNIKGERVTWKYFDSMRFLEMTENYQTNESISSMIMPEEDTIECKQILPRLTKEMSQSVLSEQPIAYNCDMCNAVPTTTIFTGTEETAAKDQFDAFGAYVVAELCSLPLHKGLLVKRKLARALLDIMDEVENSFE